MFKNKKITFLCIVILAVIIAGIATALIKGFEYDLNYSKSVELQINTGIADLNNNEIYELTKSVLNKKFQSNIYEETINITAKDFSEEEKTNLINKINEKYSTELSENDIIINENIAIDYKDVINQYLLPVVISLVLILIYLAIRFRNQNWIKVIAFSIATIVVAELFVISVISIARLPISIYTMPVLLGVYALTVIALTFYFEINQQ